MFERKVIHYMAKSKSIFICQDCGAQRPRWEGRCTDCGAWNSFVEETVQKEGALNQRQRGWGPADAATRTSVISLNEEVVDAKVPRTRTGFSEFDRVLGGGLVDGSFILLGGDPGIGKSTLLLQMSGGLARGDKTVLYVSAEESVGQSALRAQRLGVKSAKVKMAAEANLQTIKQLVEEHKPTVLVVDSIQTVFLPELASAPGSVSQVRECAAQLMGIAKGTNTSVFLIGHVTKEGHIAGPKVLEHMVDTVLSFEGDMSHQFRLLRALKNRFGATHELGVFQMDGKGLVEVENPSELFLEERGDRLVGSAVYCSMEGTRPLLCEIQALTNYSPMPQPRRTSIGFDVNRVHLLTAVLNKHLDMKFAQSDVFVNVVGGLRLIEPAADLAVAAALLSTESETEIDAKSCFFGEIGLTGEIRAVAFAEQRIREADKLGFTRFVIPNSNRKHLSDLTAEQKRKITWVKDLHQLRAGLKQSSSARVATKADLDDQSIQF